MKYMYMYIHVGALLMVLYSGLDAFSLLGYPWDYLL